MPIAQGMAAESLKGVARRLFVHEDEGPRTVPTSRPPHRFIAIAYFSVLTLLASVILVTQAPRFEGELEVFLALAVMNLAAERFPISIYGNSYISIGFVFTVSIIVLFGIPGVVIVAPFEAAAGIVGRKPLSNVIVTNAAMFIVVYTAAAAAYGLVAPVGLDDPTLRIIPGVAVATIICFAGTAFLIAVAKWMRTGHPLTDSWSSHKWLFPHYAALGVIGLALATASIALGIAGIIAFLLPAVMMRLAMKQYVDKTAEHVAQLQKQNDALIKANIEIRRVGEELRETYNGTLEAFVTALDARDQETKGHSVRVARYMLNIAEAFGVKPGSQEWIDMERGALLHDVGKIGIRDSILLKPSKLDEDEWEQMRRHPEIGYNMLKEVKFLAGAAEIVLAHHERWDGKGYPRGLREDEIPLGSRIFSVVDTFDSMTSDRPYRKAMSTIEALNEILRCSGTQFDPRVVEAFLDIYDEWVLERERMLAMEQKIA